MLDIIDGNGSKSNFASAPIILGKQMTKNRISIIIPFRNEEKVIESCVKSLIKLDYHKDDFEIILVNDFSDDNSEEILTPFKDKIKLINATKEGKKNALETGIAEAKHSWILSSDADCAFQSSWLNSIDELIDKQEADLYILPVAIRRSKSLLNAYQFIENLISFSFNLVYFRRYNEVLIASGANLLYSKEKFQIVDPYNSNRDISSGDDMFLLQAFKENNLRIALRNDKGLWVETNGQEGVIAALDQRIRWVSKMKWLKKDKSFKYGVIASMIHLSILAGMILSFYWLPALVFCLAMILILVHIEMKMIRIAIPINHYDPSIFSLLFFEIVYVFTLPFLVILSIFRTPKWKGRKIGI